MKFEFWKYQGTGNDFVMLDGRETDYRNLDQPLIEHLCDRRFGIGADGLIILKNADGYDFEMEYFNSDGRTSSMCGNGGRCIIRFAKDLGIDRPEYFFKAIDGDHEGRIEGDRIWLKMGAVKTVKQISENEYFLDTGSPHHIVFKDEMPGEHFVETARSIRNSENYREEGVNVNFVLSETNELRIRTYERGVEDETYSCGTGVTAAAIAASFAHKVNGESIPVKAVGGDLEVKFESHNGSYDQIWLIGPASHVFHGEIEL